MDNAITPELMFRMSVKCSEHRVMDQFLSLALNYSHFYENITAEGNVVTFEAQSFSKLLCVVSFYKSAISLVDDITFEEVYENKYLNSISFEIDYASNYWATRCLQELHGAIAQCGVLCQIKSPSTTGNTTSVVCSSWDAFSNLDMIIMKAGYGFSKHKDHEPSNTNTESNKPILAFGVCMATVLLSLICLI